MCNVKGFVSDWRCLPSLFRFRGRAQVWAGRRWAVMFGMRALYCHQHYHHQHQHTAGTSEYKECYLDVESTGNLVLLKTIMSGAVRWWPRSLPCDARAWCLVGTWGHIYHVGWRQWRCCGEQDVQFHTPLAIIYCPLRQHGLADDVDSANIYIYLHHTFIHLHLEPSKNINRIKINSKFVLTIYFSNCEKVTHINEKIKYSQNWTVKVQHWH